MQVRQGNLEQNISDDGENSSEIQMGNMEHAVSDQQAESSKPVDVSSRVWRLFLDSKCSSATVFFRLHLSARTYFHSPTPWNPGSVSNLSRKVTQLLDSFRPGSSSYSPFQSKSDENNNESNEDNENIEDENNNGGFQLLRPSEITARVIEETNPDSRNIRNNERDVIVEEIQERENINNSSDHPMQITENETLSPEEENRRRLYLNLGRPRPFYRVPSRNDQNEPETRAETKSLKKKRLLTLKEISKNQIVSKYGLKNLRKIIEEPECSLRLPVTIKNFLFTFPCHDFEEDGFDRPSKSASYNVRSHLDGEKYTAVFATSEVDKAASNLWEDEADWLRLADPGVTKILAIAVDPLTENIFYIIPERGTALTEVINSSSNLIAMGNGTFKTREDVAEMINKDITITLERLQKRGKTYGSLREENIFIYQGQVLIENKLLVKISCNSSNLDKWEEHEQNLHKLNCIREHLLK